MFSGSFVAIVTPFKDGKIDFDSLGGLIDFQINNGTNGIIPCGTTGESATLSCDEHNEVIRFTIEKVSKRVPVIAGTGSNSTKEALILTESAKKLGAEAALLISPYYNKPTQKGIFEHYKYINDHVNIPMILYNVPGRTSSNIAASTTVALSKLNNIIGIKEAGGNLVQISEIIRDMDPKFFILSGEDALTFPMLALGCKGVISVTANIAPKKISLMVNSFLKGDMEKSRKLHLELLELHDAMFMETNPIPVKQSLALMGKIKTEFRLPLTEISPQNKEKLTAILKKYSLI